MKRFSLAAVLIAGACAGPRRAERSEPLAPATEVENPNFEAVVVEAVPNEGDEGISFTKIFIDGKETGKTPVGPRSREKRVRLKLPVGNQLVRMEHWLLPEVGEWTRLPDAQQPRERFVRVEEGTIARITLRYGPDGIPSLSLGREPTMRPRP